MTTRIKFSDLFIDPGTGQLSHTKIWANIAYCAATFAFCFMTYKGTATAEIWFIYLGVLGTHSAASKLISLKYGIKQ
ncbi:MAG: hypothetical protein ACO1N8_06240 [Methylophilus sp.]